MTTQTLGANEPEAFRFGYGDTTLGTIVVAESMHGVVALFIGDDRAKLLRDLKDAFPEAEFVLDQTSLAQTIAKAAALVDAPQLGHDLTLDLRGSPVEVAVWKALQAIPSGETRTYGAIRNGSAHDHLASTSEVGLPRSAKVGSLNIETVASNPSLPTAGKWALRFDAAGTVTIVLGMRVYAMGCFSAYFAGLVSARLAEDDQTSWPLVRSRLAPRDQ